MENRIKEYHHLKTETEYYQAVEQGLKKFELRKNDRNFQVGDYLFLQETVNGIYTGRQIGRLEIKYILYGGNYGLDKDYCIICW